MRSALETVETAVRRATTVYTDAMSTLAATDIHDLVAVHQ